MHTGAWLGRPGPALTAALTPETGARAAAVAGTIRTDGAAVAATLLLDTIVRTSDRS
ncbi:MULTISPECIES: hypothetical protein [Rhodococcus]|uniref:hypothetical protein n=1 Tax=Rhodococcus TaxID=1827 RepID=UPI0004BC3B9D|nr:MULTISPECIES: hypothetical protein [Rhodococcus]WAM11723.1 hypothetical protein OYT95_19900 [Rhodococcus sp. JS3073]